MLVVNSVVMITKEFIGLIGSIVGVVLCVVGCCMSSWCLWNDWRNEKNVRNGKDEEKQ